MSWHLGRRRRNQKDLKVRKNLRVKDPKAKVKENPWKKDRDDLKKYRAVTMDKVMGRKEVNQAEDEEKRTKRRTMTRSGSVWRT